MTPHQRNLWQLHAQQHDAIQGREVEAGRREIPFDRAPAGTAVAAWMLLLEGALAPPPSARWRLYRRLPAAPKGQAFSEATREAIERKHASLPKAELPSTEIERPCPLTSSTSS